MPNMVAVRWPPGSERHGEMLSIYSTRMGCSSAANLARLNVWPRVPYRAETMRSETQNLLRDIHLNPVGEHTCFIVLSECMRCVRRCRQPSM